MLNTIKSKFVPIATEIQRTIKIDALNVAKKFNENATTIISASLLAVVVATPLWLFADELHLAQAALNADMTLFSLISLITIAAVLLAGLIALAIKKRKDFNRTNIEAILNYKENSVFKKNPGKHAVKGLKIAFSWLGRNATRRPSLMALFGLAYIFPATILFMHFYGGVQFTGGLGWLLDHAFLPVANGMVAPGHAQWIAALATGFFFAKILYIIGDLIYCACEGEPKKSALYSVFASILEKPLTNFIGMAGLFGLVYMCAGIHFFTHLSGSWLVFNLATVLLKVVLFLYDTIKSNQDSLVAKTILLPFRAIYQCTINILEFLPEVPKQIYLLIYNTFNFLVRMIIWPILRVFIVLPMTLYNKIQGWRNKQSPITMFYFADLVEHAPKTNTRTIGKENEAENKKDENNHEVKQEKSANNSDHASDKPPYHAQIKPEIETALNKLKELYNHTEKNNDTNNQKNNASPEKDLKEAYDKLQNIIIKQNANENENAIEPSFLDYLSPFASIKDSPEAKTIGPSTQQTENFMATPKEAEAIRELLLKIVKSMREYAENIENKAEKKQIKGAANALEKVANDIATEQMAANFETGLRTWRRKTSALVRKISFFNWLFLAFAIYTILPIFSLAFFHHVIVSPVYNWYTQLAIDVKLLMQDTIPNIDTPLIMAIFAFICLATLFMLNSSQKHATKHVFSLFIAMTAVTALVLVLNTGKKLVLNLVLDLVCICALLAVGYHIAKQFAWVKAESKEIDQAWSHKTIMNRTTANKILLNCEKTCAQNL